MFRITFNIMMTLLLVVVLFPADLLAGGDDGPEILWDDCSGFSCEITIGSVDDAFPGHDVIVPVTISTDAEIGAINLNILYESGITFNSLIVTNSDWSTDIQDFSNNTPNNPFWVQLRGDHSVPAESEDFLLFEISFTVNANTPFGEDNDVSHYDYGGNDYPAVDRKNDDPDTGFCRADSVSGTITTINGQAWFELGDAIGYSYQAQDDSDDEKMIFIEVPVYFKSNFPAKGINIGVEANSDYVEFVADASYNASASWCDEPNNKLSVHDGTTLFEPSETYYTLGTLKFVGHDYGDDYNDDVEWSPPVPINFYECGDLCDPPKVHCDLSQIELGWADLSESVENSIIQYPEYKCRTTFADLYMDPRNIDLDMQVKARHFFWTQGFDYFVAVNDADFASINVTDPANEDPGNRYQYTSYQYKYSPDPYDIYQVFTDESGTYFQQERYIPAYSNEEIFTIHLTPSQDFADCVGCTSEIDTYYDGSQHQNDISRNYDFFHPNSPQLDKIIRADTLANHFIVYSGTVTTPKLRLDVDDNVPCKDPTIVPVRIDDVVSNYYTRVKLYFTCEGGMRFDDISNGDYLISWGEPLITEQDTKLEIEGTMSQGELRAQRTLINLEFYAEEFNVATQISFDSALFSDVEIAPGQGPFYAVFTEDGSIKPCYGTGPKQDPCGDCPIPYTYFLSQAYPNPFNANTIIEFGLAEPGFVSLNVYDILGKKVRTLHSEDMEPGNYQAVWNGTNDAGAEVGSGFYFYIIQTDEFMDRKRMTLLK